MPTVTLAELKARARERADMVNSAYIADARLTEYINASAQELYDLLVQANQDYYTTLTTSTVSSGSSSITLPSDLYKLRGVDLDFGGEWCPIWPYEYLERGRWQNVTANRVYVNTRYRIIGSSLELLPADQASGDYRIRYVPLMTVMADDADTFDGLNGFEEYIVIDAAIKMKSKEESSTSDLKDEKARIRQRILAMADVRDLGAPDVVQDVRPMGGIGWR